MYGYLNGFLVAETPMSNFKQCPKKQRKNRNFSPLFLLIFPLPPLIPPTLFLLHLYDFLNDYQETSKSIPLLTTSPENA